MKRIVELATEYGRYGYRRVTALLRREGWLANHKRVERIWRQEGLKVPKRQPKRRRLWLADGSCIRLRPTHRNHVWSYDFVADRTADGRAVRMLTIVDEHTRECLSIDVARRSVTVSGTPIDLTPREYELLRTMLSQPGRLLTRGRLLRAVWGVTYSGEAHYLHVYVSRLRRKLDAADPSGHASGLIVAEPGVGYRIAEATTPPS